MLTQDQVNDRACRYLDDNGWTILEKHEARRPGTRTRAERNGVHLVVAPRGAGSSLPGTNRFGKVFTRGQVFVHSEVAAARLLRVVGDGRSVGVIAAPDNEHYREAIGGLLPALAKVRVGVLWVPAEGRPVPEVPFGI